MIARASERKEPKWIKVRVFSLFKDRLINVRLKYPALGILTSVGIENQFLQNQQFSLYFIFTSSDALILSIC